MPNKVFTKNDCGCYADSARGIYIGQDVVIPMAEKYGFVAYPERDHCCGYCSEHLDAGGHRTLDWEMSLCEHYNEIWDEAEDFLTSLCEDGLYFGGNESGDFGLWEVDSDE